MSKTDHDLLDSHEKSGSKSAAVNQEKQTPEVTTIRTKGHTSLVEWTDKDGLQRAWLPTNEVGKSDPSLGMPFGDEIAEALTVKARPKDIEQALRRVGIWTWDDVINQAPALPGILQDAFGVLNQLLATARKEQKNGS